MLRMARRLFLGGAFLGLLTLAGCGGSDDTPYPPARMPLVGFLQFSTSTSLISVQQGFVNGLAASGFVDGKNIHLVTLNGGGSTTTDAANLQSLINQKAVIIGTAGTPSLQDAVAGTTTTPVVFAGVTDPIQAGAGTTDSSHKANITGIFNPWAVDQGVLLTAQVLPGIKSIGTLYDPTEVFAPRDQALGMQAAQALGIQWVQIPVQSSADISNAVQQLKNQGVQAIMQVPSNTINPSLVPMLAQAQQLGLPFFSVQPDQVSQGVIAAKGLDLAQAGYQAGQTAAQILRGTNPATIPFVAVTKTQLIVNLTAAKQFNVTIPPAVIQQADQVLP